MESTNTIILDDDFILPYSLDTMDVYEKLSKISRKNYDLEFSKTLNQNLIKELKALVSNSSLNEDVVLISAPLPTLIVPLKIVSSPVKASAAP